MPDQESMPLDEKLAVRAARDRLLREFEASLGEDTVDAVLDASWDHMESSARLKVHIPLLAERFARVQLWAMTRMHGHDSGVPAVLFIDTDNAGRARMAKALFARRVGTHGLSFSAGTDPRAELDPVIVEAMAEKGISISGELPKPYTQEILSAVDQVVTFPADEPVNVPSETRHTEWPVPNPHGVAIDGVRAIRDELAERVDALADELGIPSVA